jgi:hypothetical protein
MALVYNGIDAESAALIARLTLDDIEAIEFSRKNKERADSPLSDEQLALREQAESFNDMLKTLEDFHFARSLDSALAADREYLVTVSVVDQANEDDHRAALALSQGRPLPQPSQAQRALETMLARTQS